MFEQSFLPGPARTRKVWTVAVSFGAQILGIGVAILIPLIAFERLPIAALHDILVEPPPPPGRPKPVTKPVTVVDVKRLPPRPSGQLVEPTSMPGVAQQVIDPPDMAAAAAQSADPGWGIEGGIPGLGDPRASTTMRHIIESAQRTAPDPVVERPKKPVEAPPVQVRRGGDVQAAMLTHKVTPAYPDLARRTRISGMVHLSAVIGTDGRIRELKVLSGHPMLVPAAVEAVRQWLYRPTLLNGDPVEVITTIDVNFTLGR